MGFGFGCQPRGAPEMSGAPSREHRSLENKFNCLTVARNPGSGQGVLDDGERVRGTALPSRGRSRVRLVSRQQLQESLALAGGICRRATAAVA